MEKFLIVGGGVSGLASALVLKSRQIDFEGLEKQDQLGGSSVSGHFRILESALVEFMEHISPGGPWHRIDEPPKERKKGEWASVALDSSEEERPYLNTPYYLSDQSLSSIVQGWSAKAAPYFR